MTMRRIGIIGGGQLGKMIAQAARKLPFPVEISIYDASSEACARTVADSFSTGAFDDREAVKKFAAELDVITYEFENIAPEVIESLPNAVQGAKALRILQNRASEKEFVNSLDGVSCVPYAEVQSLPFSFPFPYIVKTKTLGYDGKGQYLIRGEEDLEQVKRGMVAEKYLTELTEYSMIIARSASGKVTHYPPLENVHINQILDTSEFADVSSELEEQMFSKAVRIAEELGYCGVLTVEFFFSEGQLYVNEVAPRVHNSGHITLDGASVSQFYLHLCAILDLEFPPIEIDRSWCMVNVLGQHVENIRESELPGVFYDYGKNSSKHDRKVGHINGPAEQIERLKEARNR